MTLTPDLRRSIDQIRDYLYGGGYPNPAQNAEQLSFLMFFFMYEAMDAKRVRAAKRPGTEPYTSAFDGMWTLKNPLNAPDEKTKEIPKDRLRWSSWAKGLNGERLVSWVRDEVFAFYGAIAKEGVTNFMEGARLVIDDPTVLSEILTRVENLNLDRMDSDTKGDLFEHVLRQIRQAGELGQFRTPRHIIRMVVDMVNPRLGETVYDPAAGTAGFLVAAYEHIRLANSTVAGTEVAEVDGKTIRRGLGDTLSREQQRQLAETTFFGNDVDPQMVRLATMNLFLRGLDKVRILRRDALTRTLEPSQKQELGIPAEGFDVVLANPPFSGRLDKDRIVDDVKVGTTTQTELLFLKYMLNHLRTPENGHEGGRCGVVIPEGVLFGSTGAHKELRRQLIENNRVEAVMSLPGGVFNPYSGVKTSVLVFTRGGRTEDVLFLHADADGFKMDANHDAPVAEDDLPTLLEAYRAREGRRVEWQARDEDADWTHKWWFADAETIRAADFNLSAGRYRPQSRASVEHRDPLEILDDLQAVEREIMEELAELRELMTESKL
ncbi:HsdM family class I SAM-dependent methyltransferase [Leisingera sp. ANG-DT]|uniref:HsdM family class I SAM-dependent methyltransferase n=1 Tax=Leisingera sp. ANG-DT TaxID=1577897 RepID=UPI00057CF5C9|nr:N-6 DNA methylase [Leisingera sp. ANG-DT]KIC14078.1 restriction endonuclease subunit S [Leisingera sp. ANG-DT]